MSDTKDKKTMMPTEEEMPGLVDRAAELKRRIDKDTAELKGINARLALWAEAQRGAPLADARREGRQVVVQGARYRFPVRVTSDALVASFPDKGKLHKTLLDILGEEEASLELFFKPPTNWERRQSDGQKFRAAVGELLGQKVGARFVAACRQLDKGGIPKSKTVVACEEAEEIPTAEEVGL